MCGTQKWALCGVLGGGGGVGGRGEGGGEDPNGVSIEQCAQCFLPVQTTTALFLWRGWGGGRVAPLFLEEVGGAACHPDHCPLTRVSHGEAVPKPSLQEHVGIKAPTGTILVVRRGMYGGAARVPPELQGVAHVVQ